MSENKYERIVVVSDGLRSSEPTHATGLNLAKKHGASVTLVDTIQPPSTASRWFSTSASEVFEMVLADKEERLEKYAENFRAAGIETVTKILFGKSSEAITREVIASDASLVVRYMKGVRSKFPGVVGNTARSLMRTCPAPVLLVGSEAIDQPRVLACLDGEHDGKENGSIISESIRMADNNKNLYGLYCWEMYGGEMIEKRMSPKAWKESLEYTERMYRKVYDRLFEKHDTSAFKNGIRMENGQPSFVIPEVCSHENIDVVVMCTATMNHPLRRFFGSTVEAVLEKLPCSLLAVKPIGFVSPLATEEIASTTV